MLEIYTVCDTIFCMIKYTDAHCHFTGQILPESIAGLITNSARFNDWNTVVNVARSKPKTHGAIGLHPWYLTDLPSDWAETLTSVLAQNPELLVGEIGLDKHHPDLPTQEHVFTRQLHIATQMHRGVCVHCVGAWDKMLHILRGQGLSLPPFILFHGFRGPVDKIPRLADKYNAYFSYNHRLSEKYVRATPRDRILAESDSDTPTDVVDNVARLAEISGLDIGDMADIINANMGRMLNNG